MSLPQFLQNANGILCAVRSLGIIGGLSMIVKFCVAHDPHYSEFGQGLALIMTAIVAQHFVEGRNADNDSTKTV